MKKFDKSVRLSDVVSKFVGTVESEISNYGTNGILTHGTYTRTDEFIDSVKCAISTKFKKSNQSRYTDKQYIIKNRGHINSETGYTKFEEILKEI